MFTLMLNRAGISVDYFGDEDLRPKKTLNIWALRHYGDEAIDNILVAFQNPYNRVKFMNTEEACECLPTK